jgi:hypothetical protein
MVSIDLFRDNEKISSKVLFKNEIVEKEDNIIIYI